MQESTAALTFGLGLPAWFAREAVAAADEKESGKKNGAPIVMGAIGTGSRGLGVMEEAARRGAKFVAVCDVDARHRKEAVERIHCPVYGFYGGNDARINATIPRTTELMKKAAKTYEPVIYEGAGHGFLRAGEAPDAGAANQKARDQAWERWKELLKKI